MLAHLISFDAEIVARSQYGAKNSSMMTRYKQIRKELEKYDKKLNLGEDGLSQKEEIIILTKADAVDEKVIKKTVAEFKKLKRGKQVFILSLFDDKMVKKFGDELIKILKKK